MNEKVYTLGEIRAIVAPIARAYGIAAMYLFGSYARGEATAQSDIDLRVEKGAVRSLFVLGGLYSDLEQCFDKRLDIVSTQGLSPAFLSRIAQEEVLIYQAS